MFICICLISFSVAIFSMDKTVILTGISSSQDMNKAVFEAQNDAKRKAIESVCGINLKSSTAAKNYQMVSDIILAESYGEIKDFKILNWEVSNLIQDPKQTPVIQLSVEMEVVVSVLDNGTDESYHLSADLKKNVLFENDEISIDNLQVTKDSYIYLFSINNSKTYPIVPNSLIPEFYICEGEIVKFPSDYQYRLGMILKAGKATTEDVEYEQLLVVAMKNKNSIFNNLIINNKIIDVNELSEVLLEIPANDRVMKILDYEIRKLVR